MDTETHVCFTATAQECMDATRQGKDSALLNYGRSGSGKTYTTCRFVKRILQNILPGSSTADSQPDVACPHPDTLASSAAVNDPSGQVCLHLKLQACHCASHCCQPSIWSALAGPAQHLLVALDCRCCDPGHLTRHLRRQNLLWSLVTGSSIIHLQDNASCSHRQYLCGGLLYACV